MRVIVLGSGGMSKRLVMTLMMSLTSQNVCASDEFENYLETSPEISSKADSLEEYYERHDLVVPSLSPQHPNHRSSIPIPYEGAKP